MSSQAWINVEVAGLTGWSPEMTSPGDGFYFACLERLVQQNWCKDGPKDGGKGLANRTEGAMLL